MTTPHKGIAALDTQASLAPHTQRKKKSSSRIVENDTKRKKCYSHEKKQKSSTNRKVAPSKIGKREPASSCSSDRKVVSMFRFSSDPCRLYNGNLVFETGRIEARDLKHVVIGVEVAETRTLHE